MSSPPLRRPAREFLETPLISPLEQKLIILDSSKPSTKPAIAAVPRSAVFDRLQSFLPSIAAANEALDQNAQDPSTLDIEHVDEDYDGPLIEMDLACGVLDLKDQAAVDAAQQDMARGHTVQLPAGCSGTSSSGESSSDGSDSDDEDEEMLALGGTVRPPPAGGTATSSGEVVCTAGDKGGPDNMEQDGPEGEAGVQQAAPDAGRRKVKAKRNTLIQEMS